MTRLLPNLRSPWPSRVFVVVTAAIGLSLLVTGLRGHINEEVWTGVVALGIAVAVGVYRYRSAERRKAPSGGNGISLDELPIPKKVARSAGARLAVRLGPSGNDGLGAIVLPIVAVPMIVVFWPLSCAASPEVLPWVLGPAVVGLVLGVAALATVSNWVGARKAPVVEISREPVAPGETLELSVLQHGPATIIVYEVKLVCLESTHTLGEQNTRHFEHVASEQTLIAQTSFILARGEPWNPAHTFTIPEDAMHSFETRASAITWQIVVRAEIDGWPDFKLNYPFRVLPPLPESAP